MLLILLYLILPAALVLLCQRVKLFEKIGVVVLSFALGISIAASIDLTAFFDADLVGSVQKNISEVSIALALPLILFSINVKSALSMAKDTLKGMGMALLAVIVMSAAGAVIFADEVDKVWQVAGMSVGAYTGGGPNMGAIKTAIEGDDSIFLTMITYDIVFSAGYLMFVMLLGQRVFGLFLKPYVSKNTQSEVDYGGMEHMTDESSNAYKRLVQKDLLGQTGVAFLLSGVVVGLSLGIAALLPESMSSIATILSITTLGIAASFIPKIRAMANSFQLGMYLILVFCFTTGSMVDIDVVMNLDASMAAYMTFILAGSLILQAILCKLAKIDTDTFLITSSAAIMSVPFIPVIAGALKNREILLPGFAVAVLGYAVGNYLGILVANVTKALVGA